MPERACNRQERNCFSSIRTVRWFKLQPRLLGSTPCADLGSSGSVPRATSPPGIVSNCLRGSRSPEPRRVSNFQEPEGEATPSPSPRPCRRKRQRKWLPNGSPRFLAWPCWHRRIRSTGHRGGTQSSAVPAVALGSRTDGGRCADHCSLPSSVMWRSVWCGIHWPTNCAKLCGSLR